MRRRFGEFGEQFAQPLPVLDGCLEVGQLLFGDVYGVVPAVGPVLELVVGDFPAAARLDGVAAYGSLHGVGEVGDACEYFGPRAAGGWVGLFHG